MPPETPQLTNEQKIENLYVLNKDFNQKFNAITLNDYIYSQEEIEAVKDAIMKFFNDDYKDLSKEILNIINSLEKSKRNDLTTKIKEIDLNFKKNL